MGIPEVEAKQYEGKINDGNILISVHVADSDRRDRAEKVLERHGATDISTIDEKSVPAGKAA